ncbi:MAG TPA: hypothetical protein VIR15_13685 [Intrasporangium sp.]|uniref:hypothetical protein n=1 Tax=Intrasporangium sp. TaxID=1925024 RepID=UPI002F93F0B2
MAFTKRKGANPKYRTPEHRRYRAALVEQLNRQGYLMCTAKVCIFPTRHITNPNGRARDGLHAGHDDSGTSYDGPQHNACNVTDGAVRGRARRDSKQSTLRW